MRTFRLAVLALVSLFPELAPSHATAVQAVLTGDTYTVQSQPNGTTGGAATSLKVQSGQRAFLQFSLATLPAGLTGDDIAKATLRVFVNTVTTQGAFLVHRVNGPWTKESLSHNSAPATTLLTGVTGQVTTKSDYAVADLTNLVRDWIDGLRPNHGVALLASGSAAFQIDSKESITVSVLNVPDYFLPFSLQ